MQPSPASQPTLRARDGVRVREAAEPDVPQIQAIFRAVYSETYPYRKYYDPIWLKRALYTDDQVILVAEDEATGEILGTASVVLDVGAHADLLGEFGRLAVWKEARGRGVGQLLMEGRLAAVAERLHVAVVENRVAHPYSQRISHANHFAPIGFLPLKHQFVKRESVALFARHFGNGLRLRKNHPRIIPEAYPLARLALQNVGLTPDPIVDDTAQGYPYEDRFEVGTLKAAGLPLLMRIERGRIRNREVFGPLRLQYGFFKLTARQATYLVAREVAGPDAGALAGAIGFVRDTYDRTVRVFELICHDDGSVRFLFQQLLSRCREEWDTAYVEVDVSAYAPELQRTLLELGFLPAAYIPTMVFHDVERLDVVRMVCLLIPPAFDAMELTPQTKAVAEAVMRNFRRQAVLPQLRDALDRLALLDGLTERQALRVAGACTIEHFEAGEELFGVGDAADRMYVLLHGTVAVTLASGDEVGTVGEGEALGEVALLLGERHGAAAHAVGSVAVASLDEEGLRTLTRQQPDIAVVLYRNLAEGLGQKLRRADLRLGGLR
jgi:GNAT superfamily N-acetyltransferase